MLLERDQSYTKCKHAIKVVMERKVMKIVPSSNPYELPKNKEILEQFTMGYVPTDVSYYLAQLMDENRNHFKVKSVFPKLRSEGNTTRVDISIDL